ncbi:hypothetical protein FSP39_020924 [Pinctada imbricata]|uniref:Kinase n=1 Tax=Pinctada imbricata TaxID=66713 RepID=A0AA88XTP9_PINIB|nr:hypothetical protein FSP39_020924 [Pinctada imbricata]
MPEVTSMESGGEHEPVYLQPFVHQVGGHTSMMRFDETTLCKPLINREQSFYHNIPQSLKEFTAEFRGVIEVKLHEDSEGSLAVLGYPESKTSSSSTQASPASSESDSSSINRNVSKSRSASDNYSLRVLRSDGVDVKSPSRDMFNPEGRDSGNGPTGNINPWSLKCHKRTLSKMKKTNGQDKEHCKFILLENVAAKFRYPCILDLKMGTRVHGDEVSEAKKERHMMKCSNTTSCSLGARICGMQVFQVDTGLYMCQNKYYGRNLSVEGFKQTLQQFLHNGHEVRQELTKPIVTRLKQLVESCFTAGYIQILF